MERLKGADATFLYTESRRTPFEIGALMVLGADDSAGLTADERLTHLHARLASRMEATPNFRQIVKRVPFDLGHPVWVDDPRFDLTYHIRQVALPAPGDQRRLEILLGRLLSTPLDHERPLWELYIIEGLADGRCAVFIKTHHALMDGVAGFNALAAMVDLEPGADALNSPEPEPWEPRRPPTDLALMSRAALDLAETPVTVARGLTRLAGDLWRSRDPKNATATDVLGASLAPATPFNTTLTGPRRIRLFDLPLSEVSAVRDAATSKVRPTVNDVALCLVGGAVRRYLDRLGQLPDRSLLTLMPLAVNSGEIALGGNSTQVIAAELGTQYADPHERLAAIANATAEAKSRSRGPGAPLLLDLSSITGPVVGSAIERLGVAAGMTQRLRLAGNVVVSNVAAMPLPLWCLGRHVEAMYPIGPVSDGVGLNFTLLGYADHLRFSLYSDEAAVPQPDKLVADVRAEWAAMLAGSSKLPSAKPAASKRTARKTATKRTATKKAATKKAATKKAAVRKAPTKKAAAAKTAAKKAPPKRLSD